MMLRVFGLVKKFVILKLAIPYINPTLYIHFMMILTTTETVPGREVSEVMGIARGSTVRARNIGKDIFAGLKNIVGGEISQYTILQARAREEAIDRMIQDAERMGADAVVNVRFSTSMIMAAASEILAYGTAVKLSPY